MEHWHAVPELQTLWLGVVRRFADGLALEIERERARGLVPPGIDSRQLATALIWATERCLYVAGVHADDHVPDERSCVEPLLALWLGVIYGPARGARGTRRARGSASPRSRRSTAPASRQRRS